MADGFYAENSSHRSQWFKVFVTFNPDHQTTTVLLHNLLTLELDFIHNRLNDVALHPVTIHPMFIPALIMEVLFCEAMTGSNSFGDSIRLQQGANSHTNEKFKRLAQENLDVEEAAATALGNEQIILGLLKRSSLGSKWAGSPFLGSTALNSLG